MNKQLCLCGCAMEVKPGNKYIYHHSSKGKDNPLFGRDCSEETKAKIAVANSGKKRSEEAKTKMSIAQTGKTLSEEHKAKISASEKGRVVSEETKAKISVANTGHSISEENKAKLFLANKGKKHSEEHKAKNSLAHIGHFVSEETKAKISLSKKGEKCYAWQGGISNDPYGHGNDEELKEKVRIRDNYTCQECGKIWVEGEEKFISHHIDYDKSNHVMWNRITLCRSCHSKTNIDREYWIVYFREVLGKNCVRRVLDSLEET